MPRTARRDIVAGNSDIARFARSDIILAHINSRSEYHSAQAEYHCIAISLGVGEYNFYKMAQVGTKWHTWHNFLWYDVLNEESEVHR